MAILLRTLGPSNVVFLASVCSAGAVASTKTPRGARAGRLLRVQVVCGTGGGRIAKAPRGAQRTTPRTLPLLKVRSQRSAENFLTLFFIEVFCIFLFFGRRSQRTVGGVWALRGGRGGRAVFLLRLPAQNENGTARRAAQISNKQNNPTIWGVPHYHYPPRMPPAALEKKWGYDIVTSLLRSSCPN